VFDAILLRPRMMVDISQRDLRTTVLGQEIRFPIMLDPAGNHAAAHPEGELASARAAGAAGTILVLSAQSSRTLEEVAQTATGPLWFQQYFFKDRSLTLDMARRAEEAGYSALCLTLDAKVKPKRERNMRNNYVGPASPNYAHLPVTGSKHLCISFLISRPSIFKGFMDFYARKFMVEYLPGPSGWMAPRAPTTCGTRPPPGRTWTGWRPTPACLSSSRASWWGRTAGMPPTTAPEA